VIDNEPRGGWAYICSRALVHLTHCAHRPSDATDDDVQSLAVKLADGAGE
jgi:hypothetical protein